MKTLLFKSSPLSLIGVELEFQIVNPLTYDLVRRAKDLLREISDSCIEPKIKPEVTQSLIEMNCSIHVSPWGWGNEFAAM